MVVFLTLRKHKQDKETKQMAPIATTIHIQTAIALALSMSLIHGEEEANKNKTTIYSDLKDADALIVCSIDGVLHPEMNLLHMKQQGLLQGFYLNVHQYFPKTKTTKSVNSGKCFLVTEKFLLGLPQQPPLLYNFANYLLLVKLLNVDSPEAVAIMGVIGNDKDAAVFKLVSYNAAFQANIGTHYIPNQHEPIQQLTKGNNDLKKTFGFSSNYEVIKAVCDGYELTHGFPVILNSIFYGNLTPEVKISPQARFQYFNYLLTESRRAPQELPDAQPPAPTAPSTPPAPGENPTP